METSFFGDLPEQRVLEYLAAAYAVNPRAEVPLVELERELGLEKTVAVEAVRKLAALGYVKADLFLVNVWVQMTDQGLGALDSQ